MWNYCSSQKNNFIQFILFRTCVDTILSIFVRLFYWRRFPESFSFLSFIEIVEFFYKFFPFPGTIIYDVISFQKFSFSEVEQRQLTVDMESGWGKNVSCACCLVEKTVFKKRKRHQVWKESNLTRNGSSLKRQFLKRIKSEKLVPKKDQIWKDSSWKGVQSGKTVPEKDPVAKGSSWTG